LIFPKRLAEEHDLHQEDRLVPGNSFQVTSRFWPLTSGQHAQHRPQTPHQLTDFMQSGEWSFGASCSVHVSTASGGPCCSVFTGRSSTLSSLHLIFSVFFFVKRKGGGGGEAGEW